MKMIIMTGIPGSGKSRYCKEKYPEYNRVSQDELGSRKKCINKTIELLEAKHDVIIDRCNTTFDQRKHWVDLAKEYGVDELISITLEVDENVAIRRIVFSFNKDKTYPNLDEGFNKIEVIKYY